MRQVFSLALGRGLLGLTVSLAFLLSPASAAPSSHPHSSALRTRLADADFEHPVLTGGFVTECSKLGTWRVGGACVDLVHTSAIAAGHGNQSVDLNAGDPGWVSQKLSLAPGKYQVRFLFTGNPDPICGPLGIKRMSLLINGHRIGRYTFDTTGHTKQDPGWVEEKANFNIGSKDPTNIKFVSRTPGTCAGPMLDYVRLRERFTTTATNWSNYAFDSGNTGHNPFEHTIGVSNVPSLSPKWTFHTFELTSPAVVVDGVVYVGNETGYLYALDASSGNILWTFRDPQGFAIHASPTVVHGVLYFGSDGGNIFALSATTGTELWSSHIGEYPTAPAVVNGVLYTGSYDDNLYALSASTGATLWTFDTGNAVFDSPAIMDGLVYISAFQGNLFAIRADTGEVQWQFPAGGSPIASGGAVFVAGPNGIFYALDAATGQVTWQQLVNAVSDPAVGNGAVYVATLFDNFVALDAATGATLWARGGVGGGTPSVANGIVYVPSGSVQALNAATGDQLWSYDLQGSGRASPAIVNGVLYVGEDNTDGREYAFAPQGTRVTRP